MERNLRFARHVCRYAYEQGFNPFASHLFYTQFMDDHNQTERDDGILMGLQLTNPRQVWFALRPGERMTDSLGMLWAQSYWRHRYKTLRYFRFKQDGTFVQEENPG